MSALPFYWYSESRYKYRATDHDWMNLLYHIPRGILHDEKDIEVIIFLEISVHSVILKIILPYL